MLAVGQAPAVKGVLLHGGDEKLAVGRKRQAVDGVGDIRIRLVLN